MKYVIPLLLAVAVFFAVKYKLESINNEQLMINKAALYDSLIAKPEVITHYHSGRKCKYEGFECPQLQLPLMRDYQIKISGDSITMYDGERPVGTTSLNNHDWLTYLILEDNQ